MKTKSNKSQDGLIPIHVDVTLRSAGGMSIHAKEAIINSKTVHKYLPPEGAVERVVKILQEMGLKIVAKGKITISIIASYEEFQNILNVTLDMKHYFPHKVPSKIKDPDEKGSSIYFENKGGRALPIPKQLVEYVDAINLAPPVYYLGGPYLPDTDPDPGLPSHPDPDPPDPDLPPSPNPPSPSYFHLKVPDDIARLVDAKRCHDMDITGAGVTLAMPDVGTFTHPYYTTRGYHIEVDSRLYDMAPVSDELDMDDHGTAIAANALAVAPGVTFKGVRCFVDYFGALPGFLGAVSYRPDVISISWGVSEVYRRSGDVLPVYRELEIAIASAIGDGITICCACGNLSFPDETLLPYKAPVHFPSTMEEVISVGGAYVDKYDALQASNYASSGWLESRYPEADRLIDRSKSVPDLTGLVGQAPKGIYITLPAKPGGTGNMEFGGGEFPDGDETPTTDGWIVASGTSSAAPQVAGVVCLLIESDYEQFGRKPHQIKQRLMETALDVDTGISASGNRARDGRDVATGHGMVDAFIALNKVDIWVKDNKHDRGLVPSKSPRGGKSPDIKILGSPFVPLLDGTFPIFDLFDDATDVKPKFNETYYVYIKVRNRGIEAAEGVTVSLYFANPDTFSILSDWMDGQSGDSDSGVITVRVGDDLTNTNNVEIDNIPAKSERIVGPFAWTPPAPSPDTLEYRDPKNGKTSWAFCLLTRIHCEDDPILVSDGSQESVWQDNNIGMKTIWVGEAD